MLARTRKDINWPVAKIDMQGFTKSLDDVFTEVVDSWQRELKTLYLDLEIPNWTEKIEKAVPSKRAQIFRKAIRNFVDLASKKREFPGLFLFIDESDVLFNHSDYFEFSALLRSLAEDHYLNGRFVMLMAGWIQLLTEKIEFKVDAIHFFLFSKNTV